MGLYSERMSHVASTGDPLPGAVGTGVLFGAGVAVPPKLTRTFPAGIPLILSVLVEESYVQLVSGEPLTDTVVGCFVA